MEEELKKLIKKWRQRADDAGLSDLQSDRAFAYGLNACADELERTISKF